ncbi:hypothetical protein NG895_06435 [Aeoliella sp. ICT_H6.2]|uniref:Uncharacterized protein n=1 Tax=Aeoliella straminimaris TaxID=2954799 RepID=A0A9X2JF01_9BACT|nr:hypothetical protein [Aeoliella straminimaris]MCO6043540.1 hypothetical protein [Aeoliella straminimaris]
MLRADLLKDPLTQVVFIHHYLQLCFQDAGFSFYNPVELIAEYSNFLQGEPGFADALVGLIDQEVARVVGEPSLTIEFKNGVILKVAEDGEGPEAWEYYALSGESIVEQNT